MYVPTPVPRAVAFAALLACISGLALGAPPPEVAGVGFADRTSMFWSPAAGADAYNVYLGRLSSDEPFRCHAYRLAGTTFSPDEDPPFADGYFYVVTAESDLEGEGPAGLATSGQPRPLLGTCGPVMRTHVLNRLGYGWSEWSRNRVAGLGLDGYIAEQLVPSSISELTNFDMNIRLGSITPPNSLIQLIQQQVIRAVYSRRQLEQQYATFWANHFNTDWNKIEQYYETWFPACDAPGDPPQCDPTFPLRAYREASRGQYGELEDFRGLAFEGNFREMVEASGLSPAMIVYLDTILSVVGAPNENYPRELMELHAMGVDGGYTQTDVEQLSRVITGWGLCKKAPQNADAPQAPCIDEYWDDAVPGRIVANFSPGDHDCTVKTLFSGTPQEVVFPNTCATPSAGVQDLYTAFDAIVAHPATPVFVSTKLLQRFVTDDPTPEMIQSLVDVWNDAGNPHGAGDLQALLAAALNLPEWGDPDRVRSKIKTPLEHAAGMLRGTRGVTDGQTTVIGYLSAAQQVPHANPTPTGWPEDGPSWIGTNNTLERQNLALDLLTAGTPGFTSDPISLLEDNGVSSAPGNAGAIIDFFLDAFYGGAVTPAERQAAIDFLETDDLGVPAPYDDARIRDVVAFLLGYQQFQEQ